LPCQNCSPAASVGRVKLAWPASCQSLAATARHLFGALTLLYLNAITIASMEAIADTRATSIFIMEGTPVKNTRPATKQLTINLFGGSQVKLTHLCNITIHGLPIVLTGRILPRLSIASLIGSCVLWDVGCTMVFTKTNCNVIFSNKIF
jgi:hypothetical protein